jgi:predicted phosphodiesterase
MRVAALYDIHGNLPALEAVVDEVRAARVDRVVVGGDVLVGPMPRETLDRLLALEGPVDFLCGNAEVAVLEQLSGKVPALVPEMYRPIIRWTAEQLHPAHHRVLASWPMTVRLDIGPLGAVLFCHATPRDCHEIFVRTTDEAALRPIFDAANADLVVCGHTHMPFDRGVGRTRVVNAGSIGMPFGAPGADWLLLGPDVERRHTAYDLGAAADRIRRTGYPQAEEFASRHVLQPPSAEEMLKVFSGAELKA